MANVPSMRMAALSKATGVPVATIKFYLREGLLPAGERTSPNQSQYDGRHVHRLGLVRGLTEIGGLPLATVAEILSAIDDPSLPLDKVFSVLQRTAPRPSTNVEGRDSPVSLDMIDILMHDRGWDCPHNDGHRHAAADLLTTMRRLNLNTTPTTLDVYATAAQLVAQVDKDGLGTRPSREQLIETLAIATILGDALLATFRRMAQTALSADMLEIIER